MQKELIQIPCRFTPEQHRWLRLRAAALGLSVAELIRLMVDQAMKRHPDPVEVGKGGDLHDH